MVTGIRIWHFKMFTCVNVCVGKRKSKSINVCENSYTRGKTQHQAEIHLNTVRITRGKRTNQPEKVLFVIILAA